MPELYFDETSISRAVMRAVETGVAAALGEAIARAFTESLQEHVEVRLSRDRLAAMAMQGILAAETEDCHFESPAKLAAHAYAVADAMLAERTKESPRG